MSLKMDNSVYIGKTLEVEIDRPLWSKHPKHSFEYLVNYWFIPGTISWDWEELDAYVLWIDTAIKSFKWKCIAVIHRTNDDDDKLVVVPEWMNFRDDEIREKTNFQEQYFKSVILR